jgi:Meiotically up-regulated gene 113
MDRTDATEQSEQSEYRSGLAPRNPSKIKMEQGKSSNRSTVPKRSLVPGVCVVYFIHCPAFKAIKIGFGIDAAKRLVTFQIGCPAELVLIGICQGGSVRESKIHQRFRRHRIRGEWFRATSDVMSYVTRLINDDKHVFATEQFVQL